MLDTKVHNRGVLARVRVRYVTATYRPSSIIQSSPSPLIGYVPVGSSSTQWSLATGVAVEATRPTRGNSSVGAADAQESSDGVQEGTRVTVKLVSHASSARKLRYASGALGLFLRLAGTVPRFFAPPGDRRALASTLPIFEGAAHVG